MNLPIPSSNLGKRTRDESAQPAPDSSSKLFQCSECGKSYSRVDHLARHVRLHTKEKPYPCHVCGKCFARADLLKRHVAGHDARGDHEQGRRSSTIRPGRVAKACEACAELHLKCDEQKPCTRCNKKEISCFYNSTPPPETEAVARDLLSLAQDRPRPVEYNTAENTTFLSQNETAIPAPQNYVVDTNPSENTMTTTIDATATYGGVFDNNRHNEFNNGTIEPCQLPLSTERPDTTSGFESDGNAMHDFLQTIMGSGDNFLASHPGINMSGTWTPRNVFDFGQDTNLELNDLDLGFLQDYNQQNPFDAYQESPEATSSNKGSVSSNPPSALGAVSMQKASTWRFRPVIQDSASSEQHNLSLPAAETNKKLLVDRRMTAEPLSYNMRDRILGLIVSSCKQGNVPRSVLCFPSLELMDSLLQFYLTSKSATFNGLFHLPTLRPSKLRPELVAAMIAAGACQTPDASLRKVGFALQEALRTTVPQLFENDNTLINDLQCSQCMGICLGVGLWSGNSRKMEISESFLQPYVTMVRRRGFFFRSAYNQIAPSVDDQGKELEEKWEAWIEQESRKRLVFFYFLPATRQSISLFTNPLMSYAELGLPLPAVKELWLAPSATQWKTTYLAITSANTRTPSLIDLLQDVDLLADPRALFDASLSSQILLSAAWGLIWDYRQLCSITRGHATQWSNSNLLLSSRLAELTKLLDCIRISSPSAPTIILSLELLRMHLHVSLEEVHLFAGAEGHDEARRVYPLLQDWATTPGAREAVSHAAQIVAAARKMNQGCLRDFFAIALYQAGLTLWSYGVISNAAVAATGSDITTGGSFLSSTRRNDTVALLDGPDSSAAQRFVALNRGQGAISGALNNLGIASTVLLSDPGAVMGVLIDVFRINHKMQQSLPPLVFNLTSLMEGLRTAVA